MHNPSDLNNQNDLQNHGTGLTQLQWKYSRDSVEVGTYSSCRRQNSIRITSAAVGLDFGSRWSNRCMTSRAGWLTEGGNSYLPSSRQRQIDRTCERTGCGDMLTGDAGVPEIRFAESRVRNPEPASLVCSTGWKGARAHSV